MKSFVRRLLLLSFLAAVGSAATPVRAAPDTPASAVPSSALIEPAALAASLAAPSSPPPLLLHVGFRRLFDQAHIPGSDHVGPAKDPAGLAALRARVAALPKDTSIILYCGCCPWSHCPNVGAAFAELHQAGFSRVRVLHIAHDFGTDWVDPGYPATHGG